MKTKKEKKTYDRNNRGFTLVELLAVIVVLAVIIVLTVPSVLDTMNGAKKKTFAMYAQRIVTNAQSVYESYDLLSGAASDYKLVQNSNGKKQYCINIKNVGLSNMGTYEGYVIIDASSQTASAVSSVVTYTIYLTDKKDYAYNGISSTALEVGNVADSTTISAPTEYSGCYSAS
jgi:prepilin-type N-terminal cleavage/methylation domain-containing protein